MDLVSCDVLVVGGGGRACARPSPRPSQPPSQRRRRLEGLPDAEPYRVGRGRRRGRDQAADDSLDEHAYDTISGGDWLADQDAVEAFVQEAPREMLQLEHWGCPWSREPDGQRGRPALRRHEEERTWFAADKTGFHMLHTLFQTSLKYTSVDPATTSGSSRGCSWTTGACQGVVAHRDDDRAACDTITAHAPSSSAPAAAAACFPSRRTPASRTATAWPSPTAPARRSRTWSSSSTTRPACPSPASSSPRRRAPRAATWSTRTATATCRTTISARPQPKPVLRSMELGPRDRLSQAFVKELEKGRTIDDALRRRRPPGRAAPGREDHQYEDPVRARAVPEVLRTSIRCTR